MKTRSQTRCHLQRPNIFNPPRPTQPNYYFSHNYTRMKKQFEVTVKLDPFFSCSKPIPITFKYNKFGYEDKDYTKDLYITVGKKFDVNNNNTEIAHVFNFYMKDSEKKKEEQQKEKIDKLKPCFQIKN